MAVLESVIERRTCKIALGHLGVRSLKLRAFDSGWPDRMFLIPGGRPFFIEFKRPGEKPRPKQVYIHQLLVGLGYDLEVHDDIHEAVRAIRKRLGAAQVPEDGDQVSD